MISLNYATERAELMRTNHNYFLPFSSRKNPVIIIQK